MCLKQVNTHTLTPPQILASGWFLNPWQGALSLNIKDPHLRACRHDSHLGLSFSQQETWASNLLDAAGATGERWSNSVMPVVWAELGCIVAQVYEHWKKSPWDSQQTHLSHVVLASQPGGHSLTIRAPALSSAQCQTMPGEHRGQSICDSYKVAEGAVYFSWPAANERATNTTNHSSATQRLSPRWKRSFSLAHLFTFLAYCWMYGLLRYSFSTATSHRCETSCSTLCPTAVHAWMSLCVNSNVHRWHVRVASPFVWMPGCTLVEVYTALAH